MTIFTTSWGRKTFDVEAVQVTAENMKEVAAWCNGVLDDEFEDQTYILVHGGQNVDYEIYVGDWVVMADGEFQFYPDAWFKRVFEPRVVEGILKLDYVANNEFAEVLKVVAQALLNQDAATHQGRGTPHIMWSAEETTKKIFAAIRRGR